MSKEFRGLDLSEYSKMLLEVDDFVKWKFKDKHIGFNTDYDEKENCIVITIYLPPCSDM